MGEFDDQDSFSLKGNLLLAMPHMGSSTGDKRFDKSAIYICTHSSEGAVGLVVNKRHNEMQFPELLDELSLLPEEGADISPDAFSPYSDIELFDGGPVEKNRGFVLHTDDFALDCTVPLGRELMLTSSLDALRHISHGTGPKRALVALGYAGWGAGQLEGEISENSWLVCPCDADFLFNTPLEGRYELGLANLGVDLSQLASIGGHA